MHSAGEIEAVSWMSLISKSFSFFDIYKF